MLICLLCGYQVSGHLAVRPVAGDSAEDGGGGQWRRRGLHQRKPPGDDAAGQDQTELHSRAGAPGEDGGRLLAHDLGPELLRGRHAHQRVRERPLQVSPVLATQHQQAHEVGIRLFTCKSNGPKAQLFETVFELKMARK